MYIKMAEEEQNKQEKKEEKKAVEKEKIEKPKKIDHEKIIRIMQTDIDGRKQIYTGLTKIKGVNIKTALNITKSCLSSFRFLTKNLSLSKIYIKTKIKNGAPVQ